MSGPREIMRALGTPELTHAAARVFAYYVGRANGAKVCWPSIEEISRDLDGMPPRTIAAVNKQLVEKGRLRIERRYKDTNHCFILDPDGWVYGSSLFDLEAETALQKTSPAKTAPEVLPSKNPYSDPQKLPKSQKTQESLKKHPSGVSRARARPRPTPTPVDPNFHPSAKGVEYAKLHGVGEDQVEEFIDHHLKKGTQWCDWEAAWKTWCRRSVQFGITKKRATNGHAPDLLRDVA